MISAVLRELPLADRVSARRVCRTWSRILDTDSRCWSNASYVKSIGGDMNPPREMVVVPYENPEGQVNQVPHHNLYKALGFLTSRKATIRSLELDLYPRLALDPYHGLKHLSSELSQRNIKLKALLFRCTCSGFRDDEENEAVEAAFLQLLQSQPSLERLHLESVSIPIQSLRQALPQLPILCLRIGSEWEWEAFQAQAPQLSGLDGFRLAFTCNFPDSTELANMSSIVESGSSLRRVEGIRPRATGCQKKLCLCCLCCGYALVWGTESLSPAAAAFLLMPTHIDIAVDIDSCCCFKHHRF